MVSGSFPYSDESVHKDAMLLTAMNDLADRHGLELEVDFDALTMNFVNLEPDNIEAIQDIVSLFESFGMIEEI